MEFENVSRHVSTLLRCALGSSVPMLATLNILRATTFSEEVLRNDSLKHVLSSCVFRFLLVEVWRRGL